MRDTLVEITRESSEWHILILPATRFDYLQISA